MNRIARTALIVLFFLAPAATAQTTHKADKTDFDYLLGDWQFTADSKQWGKFGGYWSAVRIGDGPLILDEYRIVDDDGKTVYVTRTLRAYNPKLDRWDLVSTDAQTGLQNVGTGYREGGEVHITQQFGTATMRIRYHDIQPDHFLWTADRSTDGGKTWVENSQQIEAHRIGPARTLAPIAPEKKLEKR